MTFKRPASKGSSPDSAPAAPRPAQEESGEEGAGKGTARRPRHEKPAPAALHPILILVLITAGILLSIGLLFHLADFNWSGGVRSESRVRGFVTGSAPAPGAPGPGGGPGTESGR